MNNANIAELLSTGYAAESVAPDLIKQYVELTRLSHDNAYLRQVFNDFNGHMPTFFELNNLHLAIGTKLREIELEIQKNKKLDAQLSHIMGWR